MYRNPPTLVRQPLEKTRRAEKSLSGRPVVWSGGLVQAHRANVQARRADEGAVCNLLPRHVALPLSANL